MNETWVASKILGLFHNARLKKKTLQQKNEDEKDILMAD